MTVTLLPGFGRLVAEGRIRICCGPTASKCPRRDHMSVSQANHWRSGMKLTPVGV